jgi:hypothetical protein
VEKRPIDPQERYAFQARFYWLFSMSVIFDRAYEYG